MENKSTFSRFPRQTKPHRLDPLFYRGNVIVSITCCIEHKRSVFVESSIVQSVADILQHEVQRNGCTVLVYLFMPDHCHFILQGTTGTADILQAVSAFKQQSGFWFGKNMITARWQTSFYDHIIRSEEEISKHVNYILFNPVRKELVKEWKLYPYKGSMVYNFEEWEI